MGEHTAKDNKGPHASKTENSTLYKASFLSCQRKGVWGLLTQKYLHLWRDRGLEHTEAAGQLI